MRIHQILVAIAICAGLCAPVLKGQNQGLQKPAGAPASDADVEKLMQDLVADDWQKSQPAEKKIGELDAATKAKLIPRLIDMLADSDHNYAPGQALVAIGTPALPALLKAAQNDTGPQQQMAVGALGDLKTTARSAIPVLLSLAKTADKDLRGWVVEALGKIGPAAPEAPTVAPTLTVLMAALNDNVNGCESALAYYGASAVPGLRKVLQTSTDSPLRIRAIDALAGMGAPAAPATPELIPAVKDPATRTKALWALKQIGPGAKQAAPVLKKVVLKDPDYWAPSTSQRDGDLLRKYALEALAQMGVEPEFLIQAMKDGAPEASGALSKMGAAIVPAMRAMLTDPNPEYRRDALSVLGGVGAAAAPAVPDIIQAMAQKETRPTAMRVLGEIGPAAVQAVPVLNYALLNEDDRGNATLALGEIGPGAKDAVPYLIDILEGKPQFTAQPPPPGSQYIYGERLGEIGRIGMNVIDESFARDALEKIGTPEALAAVKKYDAEQKK